MADLPILIVDDEAPVRTFLRCLLERAGYPVVEAAEGQEALKRLQRRSCALVLTDIYMPAKDGLTLLDEARQTGIQTPFILFSGRGDVDLAVEAIKAGAQDFLCKPFTQEELLAKVAQYSTCATVDEQAQVIAYVQQHYRQFHPLQEVAQALGLAPRTVSRYVANGTGMSFEPFLYHCRLEAGRRLLETTELTIAEIAYRVGFHPASAPQMFSRLFRQTTGMTPTQYRLAIRGKQPLSGTDEKPR